MPDDQAARCCIICGAPYAVVRSIPRGYEGECHACDAVDVILLGDAQRDLFGTSCSPEPA